MRLRFASLAALVTLPSVICNKRIRYSCSNSCCASAKGASLVALPRKARITNCSEITGVLLSTVTCSTTFNNCYGINKLEAVSLYLKDRVNDSHTMLYTDHHSDLPLMAWVDEAIAINLTKKREKSLYQIRLK